MNNKTLGVLALLGAPSMAIGIYVEDQFKPLANSWWTGVWGIVYITAWMGSMVALNRIGATGSSRFGRTLPLIMLGTLAIANVSNGWQLVAPTFKPTLFWALDMCWPLSNVLMLIYGITVIVANRLPGWQRFVPLLCGLWLPMALTSKFWLPSELGFSLVTAYSAVAWSLLALVILTNHRSGHAAAPLSHV
ncbi:hypothetical protein DYU11_29385 [Fibrisoma montanum]|uniref:Uncharacterized protein n=1 Tax=Fibrisoma montanum TaxID=2305895 RepID=A0A418LXV2_9BACT|nr:hypothetical protein [Fibrisoma montanum]RIV18072.1 hypothetical protein DYU11_29385 [Fibrisoma montanum]